MRKDDSPASTDLAYLLELRLRVRGNAEARAFVDRCIALTDAAAKADAETLKQLESEVVALADGLALRFGAPPGAPRH